MQWNYHAGCCLLHRESLRQNQHQHECRVVPNGSRSLFPVVRVCERRLPPSSRLALGNHFDAVRNYRTEIFKVVVLRVRSEQTRRCCVLFVDRCYPIVVISLESCKRMFVQMLLAVFSGRAGLVQSAIHPIFPGRKNLLRL
jgi:hypothetical protein